MGSHPSKPLEKPDGYDERKWKILIKLFDDLDSDSDMGVNSEELSRIADVHIQTCIQRLEAQQRTIQRELEHEQTMAEEEYRSKCEAARVECDARKGRAVASHGRELGIVTGKVHFYRNLEPHEKGRALMKAICGGDGDKVIGFWRFFEHFKDSDIHY